MKKVQKVIETFKNVIYDSRKTFSPRYYLETIL